MSNDDSASAEPWLRGYAAMHPNSEPDQILPDQFGAIARELEIELPFATTEQRLEWLSERRKKKPNEFKKPVPDTRGLTADQRLAVSNGEEDKYGLLSKKRKG